MVHACNCSYSRGRDQEGHSLKPVRANSLQEPVLKKPFTKKGWWSGSRCRLWDQTPFHKKRKEIEHGNLYFFEVLYFYNKIIQNNALSNDSQRGKQ
jgi:hypothetical protein